MPRRSRIDAPGALHHVMVRGIDRKEIFADKKDYADFMDRLGDLLIETRTSSFPNRRSAYIHSSHKLENRSEMIGFIICHPGSVQGSTEK